MRRLLLGLFCVLLSSVTLAAGPNAVRKRAQASMLVTGVVEVAPDGSVHEYAIDQSDKLPPVVVDLIRKNVPAWTFGPVLVNGQPVVAKAKMSLRIVAKRIDDQHESIGIAGAQFGQEDDDATEHVSYKEHPAPRYPNLSLRAHVSGTVYVLARIDRQGQVADVAVEQVNLGVYASDNEMAEFRKDLAKASLAAVRQWTFNTPTHGKGIARDYWVARIPINYSVNGYTPVAKYGQWQAYVPGPSEFVPWAHTDTLLAGSADATPDGSIQQIDQGLHLKTQLGGT